MVLRRGGKGGEGATYEFKNINNNTYLHIMYTEKNGVYGCSGWFMSLKKQRAPSGNGPAESDELDVSVSHDYFARNGDGGA